VTWCAGITDVAGGFDKTDKKRLTAALAGGILKNFNKTLAHLVEVV
jgi:hypothetical protein